MTESDARAWITDRFGGSSIGRLERFTRLLIAASANQNLVASSTIVDLWVRHLLDSAQLALWDDHGDGVWLDIGSGAGLPGLVLALLVDRPFVLCEPRKLRAAFLGEAVTALSLEARVRVIAQRAERVALQAATISARAVARLDRLIVMASHCATADTTWILPRGRSWRDELEGATLQRRGVFHVKQSLSDPAAAIIIAKDLVAI